jgi:predicted membrane-bound spermidine synthase
MLIEVSLLQQFVLLLGHPVYSLTVTLFALLLGTGLGSLFSRRVPAPGVRRTGLIAIACVAVAGVVAAGLVPAVIDAAITWPLVVRLGLAAALMIPIGVLLGVPLPSGMRMLADREPALIPWGWGINGAFSVVGATLAIFIAMNWGFSTTLLAGSSVYALAAAVFARTTR